MSYSVVKADLSQHKKELCDLWQRNFGDVKAGRYEWIYEKNPGGVPTVYLLKHGVSGDFVGAISMFPRSFYLHGKKTKGYVCGDMVVDTKHRALGPAAMLLKATIKQCQEEDPCALVSFPNKKSEPVTIRTGFKSIGDYVDLTHVIRTKTYLKRYLSGNFICQVLAWPLDFFIKIRYVLKANVKTEDFTYDFVDRFDHSVDDLYGSQSTNIDFSGERSNTYLYWRLCETPYDKYKIFRLLSRGQQKLLGYIVYSGEGERVSVIDLFCKNFDDHLTALLYLFRRYQYKNGSHSINVSFSSDSKLINLFVENGFSLRGKKNATVVYPSDSLKIFKDNIDKSSWYLTATDNDI